MRSVLGVHWKDWYWSWNTNTLATWCEEMTHLKKPQCWEGLRAGGEGDDRRWDGWMSSPNRWIWVWVNSGGWWWTRRPGMLRFMGSQRIGHDWATELNWTELTMPKPLTVWIPINCGKFWKRWEYQTTWPASSETNIQVRKQQLELDMEQQTGSK